MMRLLAAVASVYILVASLASAARPCQRRDFGENSFVCVCNRYTYYVDYGRGRASKLKDCIMKIYDFRIYA